jgi:sodium/pantothenate symporter
MGDFTPKSDIFTKAVITEMFLLLLVSVCYGMSLQTYLYIGLVLFIVIVLVLAYWGYTKTHTMADFAIAGETLGPYVLGSAYAATFFSAATFVGYVGWSYEMGYANLWKWLSLLAAGPISLIIFAKRVRSQNLLMHTVSLPDWLGAFYNSQFVRVGVAIGVMFNIIYIAAQLTAGAQIFQVLLGWEYITGLIFITGLVTLYVMAGATYADVYTDAIQGVLMAFMGVFIFLSVFWVFDWGMIETFPQMSAELEAIDPNLVSVINTESILYYSAFAIFAIFFMDFVFAAQPQLFNKVLALDDPANLRKMIGTYVVLTVMFIIVIFAGFYMRILDPTLELADQAIFIYVENFFPAIVAAFLGIVILSAALSTTDGIYIVVSTAVANDIFLEFLVGEGYIEMDQDRADLVSKYLAQVTTLVVGIVAFLIVLEPPALLGELIWVGISGVAAASVPPVMLGIYFPNFVTRKGACASVIAGLGGYPLIYLFTDIPSILVQGTYAVVIASVVMILVSALTEQEPGVAEINDRPTKTPADD